MLRAVVLLCVVAALVRAQSTEISRCTVHSGEMPINAYIEGCTTPPCPMPRDSYAVVHMVFRVPYTIRRMRTYATAHMLVATIPYPLEENAETCNFITNSYCPVLSNEILQYTLKMKIENSFPLITVIIEFRIEDDNAKSFICLRVPVTVRPAVTALNGTLTDV